MDDIQVLLYIVIGIFYFISKAMKKKPTPPPPVKRREANDTGGAPQRPMTFEELLKEFTQVPEEEVPAKPEVVVAAPSYEAPVVRNYEEAYVPKYNFADDDAKRIYEESQRMAATTQRLANAKVEEDALRFKEYQRKTKTEQENPIAASIRQMLQDPNEAKKAVVLAEILNRKY